MFSSKKPSLEEQLAVLSTCGIRLKEGASVDDVRSRFEQGREDVREYQDVLIAMGADADDGDMTPLSNNVWYTDTECIYDTGDYARIVARLGRLTKDELDIRDVTDLVDVKNQTAWVEFNLSGERHHWDMKVKDDWVDGSVFSRIVTLLKKRGSNKRLTYFNLHGQDLLIGCSTEEEHRRLKKETGLDVQWLRP
jgi:hypothetical protein